MENNSKKSDNNFGLPAVDNTPMGQIQMQGELYRSMASRKPRSKFMRLAVILAALLILVLPSAAFFYIFVTTSYAEAKGAVERIFLVIPMIILGVVFVAGLRIIYNNLNQKPK